MLASLQSRAALISVVFSSIQATTALLVSFFAESDNMREAKAKERAEKEKADKKKEKEKGGNGRGKDKSDSADAEAADPVLKTFGASASVSATTAPADLPTTLAAILPQAQADIIAKALQASTVDATTAQAVATALARGLAVDTVPAGAKPHTHEQGERKKRVAERDETEATEEAHAHNRQHGQRQDADKDKDADKDGDSSESEDDGEVSDQDSALVDKLKRELEEEKEKNRRMKDREKHSRRSGGSKHSSEESKAAGLKALRAALGVKGSDTENESEPEDSDGTDSDKDEARSRTHTASGPSFAAILAKTKVKLPRVLRGLNRKLWMAPGQVEKVLSFGQTWLQFTSARDWDKQRNMRECLTIAMTIEALLVGNVALAIEIQTRRFEGVREADETGSWAFANIIGLAADKSSTLPADQLEDIREKVRKQAKKEAADGRRASPPAAPSTSTRKSGQRVRLQLRAKQQHSSTLPAANSSSRPNKQGAPPDSRVVAPLLNARNRHGETLAAKASVSVSIFVSPCPHKGSCPALPDTHNDSSDECAGSKHRTHRQNIRQYCCCCKFTHLHEPCFPWR